MSPNFSLTGDLRASDGTAVGINPSDTPSHQMATAAAIDELGQSSPATPQSSASKPMTAEDQFVAARLTIAQGHGIPEAGPEHPAIAEYRQRWGIM